MPWLMLCLQHAFAGPWAQHHHPRDIWGPRGGEANGQIQVVDVADAEEWWGLLFMYL